jgi:hypothetical protein
MQPKIKYAIALTLLTLVILALRLAVSFEVAQPGYDSYFTLVQAESIRETGLPRYHDPYSYQGRTYVFDPGFYYVIGLSTFILPDTLAVKILPNVFMALLIPLFYLLAHSLTKNRQVSFITALFGGLSPALFTTGINGATPLTLALPLLAATLIALVDLHTKPKRALLFTVILTLFSPLVWLVLAAEIMYLLILSGEKLKIAVSYLEIALVTLLMASWYTLVTYKQALFRYGFFILSKSLPASVRTATFEQFTFLAMIVAVGVVPLALGALALYHTTFEQRNRKTLFLASLGLVTLVGAATRLLPLELALVILSLVFTALAAPGLHSLLNYVRKTRFDNFAPWLTACFVAFFLLTSLLPALGLYPDNSPTPEELDALAFLQGADATILAAPTSGFVINHQAKQPYVADESYFLINNPDAILADIDQAYTTRSTVAAVELIEKHRVSHVIIGPVENERYQDIGALLNDEQCFPRLYSNPRVLVLGINCTLVEQ